MDNPELAGTLMQFVPPFLFLIRDWKPRRSITNCGGRNCWINPRKRDE